MWWTTTLELNYVPFASDPFPSITNPAQFETLTSEWVLNKHRGEAA